MERGAFVPDIGSTVINLKDIDISKPDRYVIGAPDLYPAWVAERNRKYGGGKSGPLAPVPPKAGTPAGFEYKLLRELAPDKKPLAVARIIGEVMEIGRLSDEGEFVPDADIPVLPRVENAYTHTPAFAYGAYDFYYTLPRGRPGKDRPEKEEVYEYRSGRLIEGTLQKTGNFVPKLGSKVLDFKDYNPLGRRRIYNLPGVLRKTTK